MHTCRQIYVESKKFRNQNYALEISDRKDNWFDCRPGDLESAPVADVEELTLILDSGGFWGLEYLREDWENWLSPPCKRGTHFFHQLPSLKRLKVRAHCDSEHILSEGTAILEEMPWVFKSVPDHVRIECVEVPGEMWEIPVSAQHLMQSQSASEELDWSSKPAGCTPDASHGVTNLSSKEIENLLKCVEKRGLV